MEVTRCFNCESEDHSRVASCPLDCITCYLPADQRIRRPDHDKNCMQLRNHVVPGHMYPPFDRRVSRYQFDGQLIENYQPEEHEDPNETRYVESLFFITADHDHAVIGKAQFAEVPQWFGNFNCTTLVKTYSLFAEKLRKLESIEYELPSLRIRRRRQEDSFNRVTDVLDLDFEVPPGSSLRERLLAFGSTGAVVINLHRLREFPANIKQPSLDQSVHSDTSKKSKLSQSRINNAGLNDSLENAEDANEKAPSVLSSNSQAISSATGISSLNVEVRNLNLGLIQDNRDQVVVVVYQHSPPILTNRARLTISDIPELLLEMKSTWQDYSRPECTFRLSLSFFYEAGWYMTSNNHIQEYTANLVYNEVTVPSMLPSLMFNFNGSLKSVFNNDERKEPRISYSEIDLFADHLKIKLTGDQREAIYISLRKELSGVTGPTGTGKSFVACFVALFTYFRLRQRVLIVAHRRTTAIQMLSELLNYAEVLTADDRYAFAKLDPNALYSNNRRVNLVYATGERHRFIPIEQRLSAYLVGNQSSLTGVEIVVTTSENMNVPTVEEFHPNRVIFDDANRLPMFNLMNFFCQRSTLLRSVNSPDNRRIYSFNFFGDLMQAPPSFDDTVEFVTSAVAAEYGLNLASLTLLLKCSIPSAVLRNIRHASRELTELVNDHFHKRVVNVEYNLCPAAVPIAFPTQITGIKPDQIPTFIGDLVGKPFVSLVVNFKHQTTPSGESYEIQSGKEFVNNRNALVGTQLIRILVKQLKVAPSSICVVVPYQAQASKYIRRLSTFSDDGLQEVRVVVAAKAFGLKARVTIIDFVHVSDMVGPFVGTPYNFPTVNENRLLLPALQSSTEVRICMMNTVLPEQHRQTSGDLQALAQAHRFHLSPLVQYVEHDN